LYTIHGYVGDKGMPLLWAILPNKTRRTYLELFGALRDELVSTYGGPGEHVFLTDFEIAAIQAIQETFGDCTVKGCTFHFRQAIMRRVNNEGLKSLYEGDSHPLIKQWIRQIMAMTLLPAFAVPLIWETLKQPPRTGQPEVDTKIVALMTYVESTWIKGDFMPSLWTHYDNNGPRTTNQAEGWHNSLNSRFGMPHPSMRTFLDWLQKCQYEVQVRGIQLAAQRSPKHRNKIYVKLDNDIFEAKRQYGVEIGFIFSDFSQPLNLAAAMPEFCNRTIRYLSHVAYFLVGGQ